MSGMRSYLDVLRAYAKDYVLENTGLKILALLITSVLWLSIAFREESEITLPNVPIELRHLPQSPDLTVSKSETLSARVYLRGPRDVLDSVRPSALLVFADLTGVEPGVRVIPLKVDTNFLPGNVQAMVEPRMIRVTVERLVDREVPVLPRFDGNPSAGFEVINWQISPPTVHIVGAASDVRDITNASTETVSLNARSAPFSMSVAIDIGSANVSIKDEDRRRMLTVDIGEVREERVIEHVPVSIVGTPSPKQLQAFVKVTVLGPRSIIEQLGPGDIQATIESQSRGPSQRDVAPTIIISPEYSDRVTVRSVEPKTIRIR